MTGGKCPERKCPTKHSWEWQTLDLIKQTKGISLIALVDVKQKLSLCLWQKNTQNVHGM